MWSTLGIVSRSNSLSQERPAKAVLSGASEHYEDAGAYEERYAARVEDVEYYLALAAGAGRILELGAGAGRIAIPLVLAGHRVMAVDASASMIARLRERISELPPAVAQRLEVRHADMRTFRTSSRFELIIAGFHTFCHLYSHDDVESFLRASYRHLRPGGCLAFDLPMPHVDTDGYDPLAQVRVTSMEGKSGREMLTQRLFHVQEVLLHLAFAGFEAVRVSADFGDLPVTPEADIIVVTARKPC